MTDSGQGVSRGRKLAEVQVTGNGLVLVQLSLDGPQHALSAKQAERLGDRLIEAALTIKARRA
jgi:hypothetical protein